MTNPSKMSDRKLQLAIAEELGGLPPDYYEGKGDTSMLPNWPGDIAAAMELIPIYMSYAQINYSHATIEGWHVKMSSGQSVSGEHHSKSLARAICEAWLTAWLTVRRNDG